MHAKKTHFTECNGFTCYANGIHQLQLCLKLRMKNIVTSCVVLFYLYSLVLLKSVHVRPGNTYTSLVMGLRQEFVYKV